MLLPLPNVSRFVEVPEVVSPLGCTAAGTGKPMKALEHLICFVDPASVPLMDTGTLDGSKVGIGYLRQTGGRGWV